MDTSAEMKLKEVSISAVVIRADGTREDLGVISVSRDDDSGTVTWEPDNRLQKLWRKLKKED